MKTTVQIEDGLLSEAKSYASKRNLTLRVVIEMGLRMVTRAEWREAPPFRLQKAHFRGERQVEGDG